MQDLQYVEQGLYRFAAVSDGWRFKRAELKLDQDWTYH